MSAAGKSAKCANCGQQVQIPALRKNSSVGYGEKVGDDLKNAATDIVQQISMEIDGTVPSRRLNIAYQFSLFLVAVMTVLLLVVYCGLIVSICYGLTWYWQEVLPNMTNTPSFGGRFFILVAILFATPLIAGCVTVVFVIKPIFFSLVIPRRARQRSLTRATEPALFDLVDRLCTVTRSPKPTRIDVSYDVNAAASFDRGIRSFLGRDLVLTIGVPLFAGLNLRQLAGILAHELGHFSQGVGLRSRYVICAVNFWFVKVVYQRDQFDKALDKAIQESDPRIGFVLAGAKGFVYVSRGVLWCFMILANAISCMMMRQTEFDADRYAAYVSGSEYFEKTHRRVMELSLGQKAMCGTVEDALKRRELLDDLPGIIVAEAAKVNARMSNPGTNDQQTGARKLFAIHPSDVDRINAAKKYRTEGLFRLEVPARDILKNYDAISTGVTIDLYRDQLGVFVNPKVLVRLNDPQDSTD